MKLLRDTYGVHHINFYDDLFTASRKRVVELCETLIRKPLGMDWSCAIRVGHNDDEELFALMKRAGALQLSMGIETADPGMMERHKTGLEPDMVRQTVRRIQRLGMRVKGLFIFGLPGETPESFKKTSDFVLELDLDEMNMTKFTPSTAPMWHEIIANNGKDGSHGTGA
jgi:magnesium-protoporphyrin IX monomethyl ester (oxidative) cyclase